LHPLTLSLQILLFFALLIALAKSFGDLAARFGFPAVLGELLVGLLLGPTCIDIFHWFSPHAVGGAAQPSLPAVFRVLADLGAVTLMFLAGLETDIEMMKKTVGPAFWAACGGVVLPLVGGALVSRGMGLRWGEAVFIGTILTATSVSITAQTLMNLNELRSRAGSTILAAAVIDDVLGLVILAFVTAAESGRHTTALAGGSSVILILGRVLVFLLLGLILGPVVVRFVFKQAARLRGPHSTTAIAFAIALSFAFLADFLGGMAVITGAYLAGFLIAAMPAHAEVVRDVRSLTHTFFAPVFLVSIGLEINAREAGSQIGFFLLILAIAVLAKVVGCGLGAWVSRFKWRESLVVGVGMIPRGEVGLITASLGWAAGLITPAVYSLMVVMVLVTTLLTPALLRLVIPWQTPISSAIPEIGPEIDSTG
jgi:Kef-type K+ transport system membrane component KefB